MDMLEIHAILGFKNILVCQMIYAVIWDVGCIAAVHKILNIEVAFADAQSSPLYCQILFNMVDLVND